MWARNARRSPTGLAAAEAEGEAEAPGQLAGLRRPHGALYYVVGIDLTEIEGVSELTALTLIGEIGPAGLSRFASVKKFCSWLGLCPNWKKTGGRVRSSRTRRGVNRAAQALRMS